ncbi:MAG: hypothetical protein OK422_06345 [Thaumarchaeota archaeon]|nr:hypothetical protein [Nitrososphaerota archaeon]
MKPKRNGRRAVASVIGTILFIIVFMAAFVALAYFSSLQVQSTVAAQQAQQLVNQHGKELLTLARGSNGLSVTNGGTTSSKLVAVLLKFANGTVYNLAQSFLLPSSGAAQVQAVIPNSPCGGETCLQRYNSILANPTPGSAVGIATSLGNTFWFPSTNSGSGTVPNSCSTTVVSLTMQVSPAGSGATIPAGVQSVCSGQMLQIIATPSSGYAFSSWSGSGSGSYSGPNNPATLTLTGQISETANFVPGVSISSVVPLKDGIAQGSGVSRSTRITISGQPQSVAFSAPSLPAGVSVLFSPAAVSNSMSSATTTMSISYSGSSTNAMYSLLIVATGADGQSASTTYSTVITPPNVQSIDTTATVRDGYPREHKTALWDNTYYGFFYSSTGAGSGQPAGIYYEMTSYSGTSWTRIGTGGVGGQPASCPFWGYNFDVFQSTINCFMRRAAAAIGILLSGLSEDPEYLGSGPRELVDRV